MKLLGKFYSYYGSPSEGFLYFHAPKFTPIYNYLGKTLEISIGDIKTKGSIIRYCVEPNRLTVIIAIILTQDIIKNVNELINTDVLLGIDIVRDSHIPLKRVSLQFYKKIKRTINRIAKELGESPGTIERTIRMEWGHPELNLTSLSYHLDAMGFYEFILEYIERYDLGIDLNVEDNSIGVYIQVCRRKKICVICKDNIVDQPSIYPLCERHSKEYNRNKTVFVEKYKLKY